MENVPTDLVCFSHGMMSHPEGPKIKALSEVANTHGFAVQSIDYRATVDPEERVQMLLAAQPRALRHLVLVGSSMGAYVSTVASQTLQPAGLFLLAPAFFLPGYIETSPTPQARHIAIIHGWQDEVIPYTHSVRFGEQHQAMLYLTPGDHRLMSVLPSIEGWFSNFLQRVLEADTASVGSAEKGS